MGGEKVTRGQSSMTKSSLLKIHILVVDDDSTSLAIVAAMLKTWKYEVFTVKHPVDALSTLRVKRGIIDLVVTDLHMPVMNGFELQKRVKEEFKLPVIMMSADDKESVILKSLAGGAAFYIIKPVNPDDLKNVWQYAVAAKKGKSVAIAIEDIRSIPSASSVEKITCEDINSSSSVNEEKRGKKDSKRKTGKKGREDLEENNISTARKAKVVWTTSLHNRFLQAIKYIGLEKAVPKRILEFMNVRGLTRGNVASHLQKYRIFLKKVAEKGASATKSLSNRALRSSFASGLIHNNVEEEYPELAELQQMRTSFQPGFTGNIPALNVSNPGPVRFPNDESSSSKSLPLGYRQSYLLNGQTISQQQRFGNTNPLHQANLSAFGMESNSMRTDLPSHGDTSYSIMNATNGLMNGTNSMQMYQQTQARDKFFTGGPSNYNFGTSGIGSPNHNPQMGYLNTANPSLNVNYTNNNYTGIRMTSSGELVGMGMQLNTSKTSTGFNECYGLMNGIPNDHITAAPMGDGTFGCHAQGESSSNWFENANQFPPMFPSVNKQNNDPVLPPLPEEFYGGNGRGENNYNFDMLNDVSTLNNISLPQQFGEVDLDDLFLEQINSYQTPYQQQGAGESVLNPDHFAYDSYAQVNPPMNELQNHNFSGSCQVEENAPWNEQSLGQHQGGEAVVEPNFGNSMYMFNDHYPSFHQNPNQQQVGGEFVDSELFGMFPMDNNAASGNYVSPNQGWGGVEFLDSLLGNGGPFMRE